MKALLATIFLLFCNQLFAQKPIENIVFEGAGIRGLAYAGVINVLENEHKINEIKRVGGTSAGAIIALAMSLGYTSNEIETLIYETDFSKFNDGHNFFIGGIHRLKKRLGWYKGQRFLHWIEQVQYAKTGITNITFQQLKNKGFKDLYVTATCINKQKLMVFSAATYPNMRVSDAVRISMSIPFYFEPVCIDSIGRVCHSNRRRNDLDIVMDGGILANFPIFIFDSLNAKTRIPNSKTIGIRIDTDEQIELDKKTKELAEIRINTINNFGVALYTLLLETINRNQLTDDDWKRTVAVSSKGIGPRLRKLSVDEKNLLIESGKTSMLQYLNKK
jgi:NTE family protein